MGCRANSYRFRSALAGLVRGEGFQQKRGCNKNYGRISHDNAWHARTTQPEQENVNAKRCRKDGLHVALGGAQTRRGAAAAYADDCVSVLTMLPLESVKASHVYDCSV